MQPLAILVIMVMVAFLIETLVEAIFGPVFDKIPALTPHKWALMYVALVVGVVGAFIYRFDLLAILSGYLQSEPPIAVGPFGIVITGLAIGKGSNYLHQLISRFFPAKT